MVNWTVRTPAYSPREREARNLRPRMTRVEVAARVRPRGVPCWADAWGVDPDVLEDTNYLSSRVMGAAEPVVVKCRRGPLWHDPGEIREPGDVPAPC